MPPPVRSRVKACAQCQAVSPSLYRVQQGGASPWVLICPACREQAATQAGYRYGGTWKADKRH